MASPTRLATSRWLAAFCAVIVTTGVGLTAARGDDGPPPKYTAADLTRQLQDDKVMKLALRLAGKPIEVSGVVVESTGRLIDDGAWVLWLQGCEPADGKDALVGTRFPAKSAEWAKAKTLRIGDAVTIRGEFRTPLGANVVLKQPELVTVTRAKSPVDRTPSRSATAEEFVKESLADPKAATSKYRNKWVELTGSVILANPSYSKQGMAISAGRLRPDDAFSGLSVDCHVVDDQLDAAWLLAVGQQVKVVGLLKSVKRNSVQLAQCEITKTAPSPSRVITAEEVAKAFAEDEAKADSTYGVSSGRD